MPTWPCGNTSACFVLHNIVAIRKMAPLSPYNPDVVDPITLVGGAVREAITQQFYILYESDVEFSFPFY